MNHCGFWRSIPRLIESSVFPVPGYHLSLIRCCLVFWGFSGLLHNTIATDCTIANSSTLYAPCDPLVAKLPSIFRSPGSL
ncbi:hypothetical protein ASPSYDRAFT_46360 [Aspergillus sydowii CBS 593.65]|uniref:Uncharacterized protein n=1 Tax=Aspergillus sydowii CBS 593.65 TaxID=1036612 RepID=A0A1L9TFY2_9EURO|nr:uncharacterized protein ASPSYDRAFT_46360 [Aspergillus sydowii CBS 593.65]OJJ58344.1 hypothetical protein ASPSYDRAFT_46360 [Aspergillus sydowii CBS 593.65]